MKHGVRYGNENRFKTVWFDDFEVASGFFNKARKFAMNHKLRWTVALWDGDGWLVKSEKINWN